MVITSQLKSYARLQLQRQVKLQRSYDVMKLMTREQQNKLVTVEDRRIRRNKIIANIPNYKNRPN